MITTSQDTKIEKENTNLKYQNKKIAIIIYPIDIKRVSKEYYKQLCTQKYDNLHETDQLPKIHNLPKHSQQMLVRIRVQ